MTRSARREAELRALFEEEHAGLTRTALFICGSHATAEEIVQEAFVRAAARWSRLRRYDKPGAWLRLVVVRQARRAHQQAGRERLDGELPEVSLLDPPPPDAELYEAIGALSRDQRDCIVLHHLADQPVAEVARLVGMPEGTVRSHLHRGRAALAQRLRGAATADPHEHEGANDG